MRKIVLCFTVLIILAGAARAQELMTNKDVIAMKTSKVSEDVIIAKIVSGNCDFDLSTPRLAQLKEVKISDKTIKQMITSAPKKPFLSNDDIIAMKTAKISDDVLKYMIHNCPHHFDTSPDGLIKLNNAKVSKSILKEMMTMPDDTKGATPPNSGQQTDTRGADPKNATDANAIPPNKIIKYGDIATSKTFLKIYDEYIASDGSIYKKGDTIILKTPSNGRKFQYVYKVGGLTGDREYLDARYSNRALVITDIVVENAGTSIFSSRKMRMAQIVTDGVGGLLSELKIDTENALSSGEIKSTIMSEADAIEAIKRAKEKYDLGLITQQEYEKIRTDMKKYIKD